jgi:methylated-DNA-protein-cysteine methyltransferase-like protein
MAKKINKPVKEVQYNDSTYTFFDNVYEVVRMIPKGRVTSYGAIAKYLGAAGSSRMVGWAMNASHSIKPPIPAHRVLNRNGLLTGKHHFGIVDRMQKLLEKEGIEVEKDKVVNFSKLFWDPMIELDL